MNIMILPDFKDCVIHVIHAQNKLVVSVFIPNQNLVHLFGKEQHFVY